MSQAWDRRWAKKLVIHHLGDTLPAAETEEDLRRRANPYNYEYPEYDFGILADGTIVNMRPLTVIGAHTQADKAPYNSYGLNWWNQNAASVVIAIDATQHDIPAAMRDGLIRFVIGFMNRQSFGLEGVYPHNQVTATDCPGFNYSELEAEIQRRMEGDTVKVVFFYGTDDVIFARRVAEKVGGVIAARTMLGNVAASEFYIVGGTSVSGAAENITGASFEDTAAAYIQFMKG